MSESETQTPADAPFRDRIVTIPNVICGVRLVGAFVLVGLALTNNSRVFAGVFVALCFSDWIDGKLARWLNQRSEFGARIDSVADAVLFGAMFLGLAWLHWRTLQPEAPWWISAMTTYMVSMLAGLWKYRRMLSYHTRAAKISNWLTLIGAVSVLLEYSVWPFRIAMAAVTLTNLEALLLTWRLQEWRADVPSIFHIRTGS
jgi:cardiolipin synthase